MNRFEIEKVANIIMKDLPENHSEIEREVYIHNYISLYTSGHHGVGFVKAVTKRIKYKLRKGKK